MLLFYSGEEYSDCLHIIETWCLDQNNELSKQEIVMLLEIDS